ncbi:MAG: hypothetical protein HYZ75_18990 [Elusimicrobia bacterium]|nr:hypothetical protein [Elusimicrobiota bacterium]
MPTPPTEFLVPDVAVEYILLQRTALQRYPRLLRALSIPYRPCVSFFDSRLRRRSIKAGFVRSIVEDFETLKPFLPTRARAILDIGCGVAGIDVLLHRHYAVDSGGPQFYLVDKSEVAAKIYYGLEPKAAFYNSLDAAQQLLAANGVPPWKVRALWSRDDGLIDVASGAVDLVVSLLSWGHHYPVETYLDAVWAALATGGALILDVRNGTGGEDALRRRFGHIEALAVDSKKTRFRCVKGS